MNPEKRWRITSVRAMQREHIGAMTVVDGIIWISSTRGYASGQPVGYPLTSVEFIEDLGIVT